MQDSWVCGLHRSGGEGQQPGPWGCDSSHATPSWTCTMNCDPVVQPCGSLRSWRNPTCPHAPGMLCEWPVKHTQSGSYYGGERRTNIGWSDLMRDTPCAEQSSVSGEVRDRLSHEELRRHQEILLIPHRLCSNSSSQLTHTSTLRNSTKCCFLNTDPAALLSAITYLVSPKLLEVALMGFHTLNAQWSSLFYSTDCFSFLSFPSFLLQSILWQHVHLVFLFFPLPHGCTL